MATEYFLLGLGSQVDDAQYFGVDLIDEDKPDEEGEDADWAHFNTTLQYHFNTLAQP